MKTVRVKISPPVLAAFFAQREGAAIGVNQGLPFGATLERLNYSQSAGVYIGTFSHDSLDEVPSGESPPFVEVEFIMYQLTESKAA
jgi:hypothetical protein